MRVKYFILKGKSEYPSIHVRFWDSNRIDQKTKTGLNVHRSHWNPNKQRVRSIVDSKTKDFINNQLEVLSRFICDNYIIEVNSRKHISKQWLKSQVELHFGNVTDVDDSHKVYFLDWVQRYIDEAPEKLYRGKPISSRTIQHYSTTLNKLKAFEEKENTKLRHEDINLKFYRKWVSYLRKIEKLNDNSIGGYIANIKMWARNIEIEELPISKEYRHSEFMVISSQTYDIYLNEQEITQIRDFDLGNNQRLIAVRDLFLVGLRTGLRISDFMRLEDINLDNQQLKIRTAKTNNDVIIPLHNDLEEIIERNKGLPKGRISDQKFNLYVKELCKDAGINQLTEGAKMVTEELSAEKKISRKKKGIYPKHELISSHICRRSFATNL
ncbi:tyrosine-type recombinase/integrase, partial [Nonlabens ulvanivorans]